MLNDFNFRAKNFGEPELQNEEEALSLMSLALDGLLSDREELHLQMMLAADPHLAATWRDWQQMETRLTQVIHAEPPSDFVFQFEQRLTQREAQQSRRTNILLITAALVIWGALFAGMLGFGAYVLNNQALWGSEAIHTLTQLAAQVGEWLHAAQVNFSVAASTPQTVALFVGYLCAGAALVMWWTHWLRQSVNTIEA